MWRPMKLKDQVCSLKLAQKLKDLGVKQESMVYWINTCDDEMLHSIFDVSFDEQFIDYDIPRWEYTEHIFYKHEEKVEWAKLLNKKKEKRQMRTDFCSAYSVAELGKMLPSLIEKNMLCIFKGKSAWTIQYRNSSNNNNCIIDIFADIEANARAKMVIWLIENKKVKV